jgi:hypothetical protein
MLSTKRGGLGKEIRYNNNMKLTIEGKEYNIDIEKAKELGVLKEDNTIKSFKIGDTYRLKAGIYVVVVEVGYNLYGNMSYSFAGFQGKLQNYSPFGKEGGTEEQVLERLNHYQAKEGAVFVKNINEDFKNLLMSLNQK